MRDGPRGFEPKFHVLGPTQGPDGSLSSAAYGAVTRCGRTFQSVPLEGRLVTPMCLALQPPPDESGGFGLVRVRSPLLTESLLLSFPPGTEMFQFPGLAARTYGFSTC